MSPSCQSSLPAVLRFSDQNRPMWVGWGPPRRVGSRWKPCGDGEWPCDVVRLRVKGKEGGPLTDWGREAVGRPPGAGTAEPSLKTGEFPKRECIG